MAVDSGGVEYRNPKAYGNALRRLGRWQRAQSRRTPGSRGWWQAQHRLDQAHRRVTGLRNNAHHHVSRELVLKYHTLGIETLNVAGMIKAGLLIQGAGRRRNVQPAGPDPVQGQLVRHPRNGKPTSRYPSSKTCSGCGVVNGDLGREREWDCPNCVHAARPQPECSSQSAETCATRGGRGCNAPGRGSSWLAVIPSPVKLPRTIRENHQPMIMAHCQPLAGTVTIVTHLEYPH